MKFQPLTCFNPCFVGNRSGSLAVSHFTRLPSLFQSLFCWKSVWEFFVSLRLKVRIYCFNPCFVGNRSGSIRPLKVTVFIIVVSILVLLEIGLGESEFKSSFASVPVSILVLLEIGLGVKIWKGN